MKYGNLYALAVLVITVCLVTITPATDWLWQVTTDPADDYSPAWSPDGTTIAFTSGRSGNKDIWTIPASGGTPTQITTDLDFDYAPSWSPDGSTIRLRLPGAVIGISGPYRRAAGPLRK